MTLIITKLNEPITPAEYVESNGAQCPLCGSEDLQGDGLRDLVGLVIVWPCRCQTCGATWMEHYKIAGYVDLEPGA